MEEVLEKKPVAALRRQEERQMMGTLLTKWLSPTMSHAATIGSEVFELKLPVGRTWGLGLMMTRRAPTKELIWTRLTELLKQEAEPMRELPKAAFETITTEVLRTLMTEKTQMGAAE